MSNPFDDGFVPEETSGDEGDESFEPDIATVAFLDQQQAEFGNMEEEFKATYGFEHNCHCGEDYAAGRVGEITQCYHNMMQEALATCANLNAELKEMTGIAQALYGELRTRIGADGEATEGIGSLPDEPAPADAGSSDVDAKSVPESDADGIDSGANEGLGTARAASRNTDETPKEDRKLV